jgi:hypothetical protein
MSAPSILGALELPRGIAWVVKMILIQSRRPIVPVELELNLHLVVRQRFPTERARPAASRHTEKAVRISRRQLPTADRFSGLFSEYRLVGHASLPDLEARAVRAESHEADAELASTGEARVRAAGA